MNEELVLELEPLDAKMELYQEVARRITQDILTANAPGDPWEAKSNWPSMVGHECLRFLVHLRRDWMHQAPFGNRFRIMLKAGELYEKFAIEELQLAKYECEQTRRPLKMKEENISGRIDLVVVPPEAVLKDLEVIHEGKWDGYPDVMGEVKGINPQDWASNDSAYDMRNSSKPWIRKYPAQLTIYQAASGIHMGVWILINKMTWEPKFIFYPFDKEYMDEISSRCKQVNEHTEAETYPDRIEFCETCMDCNFRHICDPPQLRGEGIKMYTDDAMFAMLARLDELREARSEYNRIDEKRKKLLEGGDNIIIPGQGGQYTVVWKQISKKGHVVQPSKYWKPTIRFNPMDI